MAELEASIERDGFEEPLVVWLGRAVVVDGHNRYRIWKEKYRGNPDREPEIVERRFANKAAAMLWMMRRQFARRNLSAAQRTAVALQMKPHLAEQAKERQKAAGGDKTSAKQGGKALPTNSTEALGQPEVREQIAAAADVSPDTVRKVEKVLESAPEKVKQEMLSGEKSVNAAYKETVGRPSGGTKFDPTEFDPGMALKPESEAAAKVPDYLADVVADMPEFRSILSAIKQIKSRLKALAEKPGGSWLQRYWQDTERVLDQLRANVKFAQYFAPCPRCEGKHKKDCDRCKGRRWISEGMKNQLSDIEQAWLKKNA